MLWLFAHLLANGEVFLPGTGVPVIPKVLLEPYLQVKCGHLMPCSL